jgi:peptidoglycan-associated lipoprotein
MKFIRLAKPAGLALVLSMTVIGCPKTPSNMTKLPDYKKGRVEDVPSTNLFNPTETSPFGMSNAIPVTDPTVREHWIRDREVFKSDTVYFDFDSSVVKSAERSKVAAVADYLKNHPENALEIEGNCDERGTEEYNRSLGERRALALREQLAANGVDPMKIDTKSLGKDRPAQPGHNETAWKKNRRGEFLLETPPK